MMSDLEIPLLHGYIQKSRRSIDGENKAVIALIALRKPIVRNEVPPKLLRDEKKHYHSHMDKKHEPLTSCRVTPQMINEADPKTPVGF
jgi:hypothetical protein